MTSLMMNGPTPLLTFALGNLSIFPIRIVANMVGKIRAGFEGGVNFFSPQAIISGGCNHRAVPGDLLRLDQPALFRIGNDVTDHRSPKIVPGQRRDRVGYAVRLGQTDLQDQVQRSR